MTAKKTGNSISRSIKINNPKKIKIACVISEWHIEITESFYSGALKKFSEFFNSFFLNMAFFLKKTHFLAFSTRKRTQFDYESDLIRVKMENYPDVRKAILKYSK